MTAADRESASSQLPRPTDDGAADHLDGLALPALDLPAADGGTMNLADAAAERVVVYVYPATGVPGRPPPPGWDLIPGARGCTPQSCAFRDHVAELRQLGAGVLGVSAQLSIEQREFAKREGIPFPLLSDSRFELAETLRLPTFSADGRRYYRRITLIVERGHIVKVFYPVFPPEENAAEVARWLRARE